MTPDGGWLDAARGLAARGWNATTEYAKSAYAATAGFFMPDGATNWARVVGAIAAAGAVVAVGTYVYMRGRRVTPEQAINSIATKFATGGQAAGKMELQTFLKENPKEGMCMVMKALKSEARTVIVGNGILSSSEYEAKAAACGFPPGPAPLPRMLPPPAALVAPSAEMLGAAVAAQIAARTPRAEARAVMDARAAAAAERMLSAAPRRAPAKRSPPPRRSPPKRSAPKRKSAGRRRR